MFPFTCTLNVPNMYDVDAFYNIKDEMNGTFADGTPYTVDETRSKSSRPYRLFCTEEVKNGPYRCAILSAFTPIVYQGEQRWLGSTPAFYF